MPRLSPGDPAPAFTLPDADGRPTTVAQLLAALPHQPGASKADGPPGADDALTGRLVVYFYPAAGTPGCTREACDFRDNLQVLADAGVHVVGISPDPVAKLARFRDAQRLTFPLLSDEGGQVADAWGAWGERTLYGRKRLGLIRSTVVVGADGRVVSAWYNVRASGHVARLLQALGVPAGLAS